MSLGKSVEDYLEAILILQSQKKKVRSIDLADFMGFSRPSISRAVKEMKHQGYIYVDGHHYLSLTKEGEAIAQKIYERHCFFKEMLIHAGVEEKLAEKDACQIEHVISDESFHKLKDSLKEEDHNME